MAAITTFSVEDARRIGTAFGIDWETSPFDAEQYRMDSTSSSSTARGIRRRT